MKALPVILGVVIVALLVAIIFIPGKNAATNNPVPVGTTTNAGGTVTTTTPVTSGNNADRLYDYTSAKGKLVKAGIAPNQKITTPITFTGNVPTGWAFEASFPIDIRDANGKVIGHGAATVPNWMSTTTAWYSVTVSYSKPATATGFIVLKRDNPSGMAANDDTVEIPVSF